MADFFISYTSADKAWAEWIGIFIAPSMLCAALASA